MVFIRQLLEAAKLPGATAPGPHHLARILDRGTTADRCLQWLEKASYQTPNLKKNAKLTGAPAPGPQHFARILNRGLKGFSLEIERASFSKKLI